jgi:hypothetical protein
LSQNTVNRGRIPKWAAAKTHLLKRMTLELMAIHRLATGQHSRSQAYDAEFIIRDEKRRVQAAAGGRRRCDTTSLELPLILSVLVLCDRRHGEMCDGTASTGKGRELAFVV